MTPIIARKEPLMPITGLNQSLDEGKEAEARFQWPWPVLVRSASVSTFKLVTMSFLPLDEEMWQLFAETLRSN
jgi:hypothetical protein